jgi:tetratricopeptide (TPR) repeat protein
MQPSRLAINQSEAQDTRARYTRIEQLVEDAKGEVSPRLAMQILGDHVDPLRGETSGFLNTVSVHTTMTSMVLVPSEGRIYVANGMGPVCENTYIELPTVQEFDPDTFLDEEYVAIANDDFKREHPEMAAAEQLLIEAKKAYEYRNDYGAALRLMNQAIKLDGENAAYHFVAAIMALKAGCHSYATSALQRSLELESSPYRRLLSHYYLGRVYAHLGSRKAARERFGLVASSSHSGPKLRAAASDSYRKTRRILRYRLKPKSLRIVFQFADMLEY